MTTPEPCRHWWLLGDLAGLPSNQGRCKLCGAIRTFQTVFTDMGYEDLRVQRPGYMASEREIVYYMAEKARES